MSNEVWPLSPSCIHCHRGVCKARHLHKHQLLGELGRCEMKEEGENACGPLLSLLSSDRLETKQEGESLG